MGLRPDEVTGLQELVEVHTHTSYHHRTHITSHHITTSQLSNPHHITSHHVTAYHCSKSHALITSAHHLCATQTAKSWVSDEWRCAVLCCDANELQHAFICNSPKRPNTRKALAQPQVASTTHSHMKTSINTYLDGGKFGFAFVSIHEKRFGVGGVCVDRVNVH